MAVAGRLGRRLRRGGADARPRAAGGRRVGGRRGRRRARLRELRGARAPHRRRPRGGAAGRGRGAAREAAGDGAAAGAGIERLRAAYARLIAIGAGRESEAAARALRRLGQRVPTRRRPRRPQRGSAALSAREREIAALVATGADQSPDRRAARDQREDGREPPDADLHQARRQQPHRRRLAVRPAPRPDQRDRQRRLAASPRLLV